MAAFTEGSPVRDAESPSMNAIANATPSPGEPRDRMRGAPPAARPRPRVPLPAPCAASCAAHEPVREWLYSAGGRSLRPSGPLSRFPVD